MKVVEYCCLVDGSETLHVLRPQEGDANDNHYVLIFEGTRDWSLLVLVGDWEYESVSECLDMAADSLAGGVTPRTGRFAVGCLSRGPKSDRAVGAAVSFEKVVPSSGDEYGRFTIRLADDAQGPIMLSRRMPYLEERSFRIYRKNEELAMIGRLLQRLPDACFEPVLKSTHNAWFLPHDFSYPSDLQWLGMKELVRIGKAHIREVCPEGFANFWLEFFDRHDLPEVAQCPECKGHFPRCVNQKWRKLCLGCHRGTSPASFSRVESERAAAIPLWLQRIDPLDEEQGTQVEF